MSAVPQADQTRVMIQSERFASQMAELDQEAQDLIWRSLNRAREGRKAVGVEKRWEGDWLLWPCGSRKVLLREMTPTEVEDLTGEHRDGICLMGIEPSPI